MNKYLMLSAAAATATGLVGSANAASYSVHFIGANGTSYCDGYIGQIAGANSSQAGGQHYFQVCASLGDTWLRNIAVNGVKGKNRQYFRGYYFSDDSFAMSFIDLGYGPSTAFAYSSEYVLQTPIAAGGKWCLWTNFGSSFFPPNCGTLAAGQYVKANARNGKVEASTTRIAEIIRKALGTPPAK